MTRILRDLAHTRAGDKGDISCISVIAHRDEDFAVLPQLGSLNFVLHGALAGGVTRSLALDAHGKSLSSALLTLGIPD